MKNNLLAATAFIALTVSSCGKKETPAPTPTNNGKAEILACTIASDLTLKDHNTNGVDYIVECAAEVTSGLLTIEPGVSIEFKKGSSLSIKEKAAIAINGSLEKMVEMRGSNSGAWWNGLAIESTDNRNSINFLKISNTGLEDFFVRYGADYSKENKMAIGIYGSASITNTVVDDCAGIGMAWAENADIRGFANNTIKNCGSYPMYVYGGQFKNSLSFASSTFTNNKENYIAFYSISSNREIGNEVVMNESPIPYLATQTIAFMKNVTMSAGVNIAVENACALRMPEAAYWTINGTSSKPVSIKGKESIAGHWSGILIGKGVSATFNYCNIADGGKDKIGTFQPYAANVSVGDWGYDEENSTLTLNNCMASNSGSTCNVGVSRYSKLINNSPSLTNICVEP